MTKTLALALVLGSATVTACATDVPDPHLPDGDEPYATAAVGAGDDTLAPGGSTASPLVTDGVYRLESSLTVQAAALLPGPAYDAVETLQGLRDAPAETLFDLAEAAGVPAVDTVRAALPDSLESRLMGWIDDEIRAITTGDGTLAQVLDQVLDAAFTPVGEVRLGSTLTLDDAGGLAVHRLDTVGVDLVDRTFVFDVAPLAAVGAELEPAVTATVDREAGTLALGAHRFGLPYGRLAWRTLEALVQDRYGRDLRGVLGAQVSCPAIAASVADRCVLGVCVGHQTELTAICEAGLDRAVSELRARVEAAAIEPIALDAAAATFADGAPADGRASTVDGTWIARLDLGQGLRAAPATFTGTRE